MNEFSLEREDRWTRGCAVGEAVWLQLCRLTGEDPKDPKLQTHRSQVVHAVRCAVYNFDEGGLDGLSEWLELEAML